MGQGRAPFLPMPFLGVAATMRVRLGGIVGSDIVLRVFVFWGVVFFGSMVGSDESCTYRNAWREAKCLSVISFFGLA